MRVAVGTLVLLFTLVVSYFLSYAPVCRMRLGSDDDLPMNSLVYQDEGVLYRPVEWAIDHTFLKAPLLTWASAWGVREQQEVASGLRWLESYRR